MSKKRHIDQSENLPGFGIALPPVIGKLKSFEAAEKIAAVGDEKTALQIKEIISEKTEVLNSQAFPGFSARMNLLINIQTMLSVIFQKEAAVAELRSLI